MLGLLVRLCELKIDMEPRGKNEKNVGEEVDLLLYYPFNSIYLSSLAHYIFFITIIPDFSVLLFAEK